MKSIVVSMLVCVALHSFAQPAAYTVANLHSHNDYEKLNPFWGAYRQGFGSIEADIFFYKGKLVVAHDTVQRRWERTLDSMYLQPLEACIQQNDGFPYADHGKELQLLVDVKADSSRTIGQLIKVLDRFPSIAHCKAVKIVISGDRPPVATFHHYPANILFDGELHVDYPPAAMDKIYMLSDNFKNFSRWNGTGPLPDADRQRLVALISAGHKAGKKVRFWNAPDTPQSWRVFMALGVDYINTDHIAEALQYLQLAK